MAQQPAGWSTPSTCPGASEAEGGAGPAQLSLSLETQCCEEHSTTSRRVGAGCASAATEQDTCRQPRYEERARPSSAAISLVLGGQRQRQSSCALGPHHPTYYALQLLCAVTAVGWLRSTLGGGAADRPSVARSAHNADPDALGGAARQPDDATFKGAAPVGVPSPTRSEPARRGPRSRRSRCRVRAGAPNPSAADEDVGAALDGRARRSVVAVPRQACASNGCCCGGGSRALQPAPRVQALLAVLAAGAMALGSDARNNMSRMRTAAHTHVHFSQVLHSCHHPRSGGPGCWRLMRMQEDHWAGVAVVGRREGGRCASVGRRVSEAEAGDAVQPRGCGDGGPRPDDALS